MSLFQKLVFVPFLRSHDWIYRASNGRIGHRVPGMPSNLLLHTVGAKTGQPRTAALTYARDADSYLVVASKAGDPRYPGWYHNLRKHPDCEVNVGPKLLAVTAHKVGPGDSDYARLWDIVNNNNADRYRAYQSRTTRPIPVVVLTPH